MFLQRHLVYIGSCRNSYARKAFLFSLNNIKGYNPVKLTQYRYQQCAMCSCSSYGPIFGWGRDIIIYNDAANNQRSYTKCGGTYKTPRVIHLETVNFSQEHFVLLHPTLKFSSKSVIIVQKHLKPCRKYTMNKYT